MVGAFDDRKISKVTIRSGESACRMRTCGSQAPLRAENPIKVMIMGSETTPWYVTILS
jgi:hypothetical protein